MKAIDQVVIDRIQELRAAGRNMHQVVHQLNADGLRTKRGSLWTAGAVYKVLRRQSAISSIGV